MEIKPDLKGAAIGLKCQNRSEVKEYKIPFFRF
jgi:hypothetical protein